MKRSAWACFIVLVVSGLLYGSTVVEQATSSYAITENFDTIPEGELATYSGNGFTLGEAFTGIDITIGSNHSELISPVAANNPLSLNGAIAGDGVYGSPNLQMTHSVVVGQEEGASMNDLARGAFSVLFDRNQSEFGLSLFGIDGYDREIDFYVYDRTGQLLTHQTFAHAQSAILLDYTITSDVPFAGVTITNYDISGLGYDSLRLSVIPEPMSVALLGLGGIFIRKRK